MFLLVPAHPGCPGQNPEAVKRLYVCKLLMTLKGNLAVHTDIIKMKKSVMRLLNLFVTKAIETIRRYPQLYRIHVASW